MRSGCKSDFGLKTAEFNETLIQRFTLKCGVATASGCIPWISTKTKKGYGLLQVAGARSRKTTAHRIAWVIARGDLDPEMLVLHRCDNPSCVNVDHLFLGSPKENSDDMVGKGRHAWRNGQPWQKLRAGDVARIRFFRFCGHSQQAVADQIGVSRALVSLVENGKLKHVTQGL